MDRRVKERLVGASILVVLIVLIVPELLSGPAPRGAAVQPAGATPPAHAPEPVRNVTVDLATSKAPEPPADSAAPSIPVRPETQRAAPASAAAVGMAGTSMASAAGAPGEARSDSMPVARLETAPPAPISTMSAPKSGGAWAVQLGSFVSRANADKLVRHLKAQGFPVYTVSGGPGTSVVYRVRVGPVADRAAAAQTAARLKTLGHTSSLVPPAP